jgi:hypothetical protein
LGHCVAREFLTGPSYPVGIWLTNYGFLDERNPAFT